MAFSTFVLLASLLVATSSAAPQNTKLGITIPEECRGKDFCSIRPEGYDEIEAKINELLPLDLIVNVGSRYSGGPIIESSDDDDNCPSETTWESVYTYRNPTETKVDIIVQTQLFRQLVAKVTCKYSNKEYENLEEGGSQCFRNLGLSRMNVNFGCKQSYATRTLLVYDPVMNTTKLNGYKIPVCCSCTRINN